MKDNRQKSYLYMDSATPTNRGYGFGLWVQGYQYNGSGEIYFNDAMMFMFDNRQNSFELSTYGDIYWDRWTGSAHDAPSSQHFSLLANKDKLATQKLSDKFQQLMRVYDPSCSLIEFLDAGTATFSFAFMRNGYNYEGGSQGGKDGIPVFMGGQSTVKAVPWECKGGWCRIYHSSGSTKTLLWDLKDYNDNVWMNCNVDVQAGDTIMIDIRSSDSGATVGGYSIYWYTNQIPGWKKADEP